MKKSLGVFLLVCILLAGCMPLSSGPTKYSITYLDLFDTVTTVVGVSGTQEEFGQQAQKIYEQLLNYHRLFDIYRTYEGINNLKTVNDQAGVGPVTVDPAIIALLQSCKEYYSLSKGKVNAAMGSVLTLWHEARTQGLQDPSKAQLPDKNALEQAAGHTDLDRVVIDETASTVFITDPELSLDVGAIAKGWAVQKVAENAPKGMLISVGGNVYATGPKDPEGTAWTIGIQSPDGGDFLHTIALTTGAVVTSGDYQRVYTVDGKKYHHIIDPATNDPADRWRSITVVCPDSALADALSTALFLLPLEEGQALAESCGAQAYWLDSDGKEYMTDGFRTILVS